MVNRPNSGRPFNVFFQVSLSTDGLVPRIDLATLQAHDESAAAMEFVFQKLERIRTLIGDVDQLRICRQMLGSLQPQQAFASFSLAKLGECFVVRHFVAAVQDLIDQSHHFARVCGDGQHILTNEAAMKTLADLPQVVGQREERGVIEFRGVMQQENGSWTVGDLCEGVLSRGRNDRGVGHVIGIAKPVKGADPLE